MLTDYIIIPIDFINNLKENKPYSKLEAAIDIISMADESGEVHMSERFLMKRWGWGNTKVRNFVEFLVSNGVCKAEIKHPAKHKQSTSQSTLMMINTGFTNTYQSSRQSTSQSINKAPIKTETNYPTSLQNTNKNFNSIIGKREAIHMIVDTWNGLSEYGISPILITEISSMQYQNIIILAKEYGVEDILKTIEKIKYSDFLQGKSKHNWKITLSWFLRNKNYEKVRNGEYDGQTDNKYKSQTAQMLERHYTMTAEWVKEMEEKGNDSK